MLQVEDKDEDIKERIWILSQKLSKHLGFNVDKIEGFVNEKIEREIVKEAYLPYQANHLMQP